MFQPLEWIALALTVLVLGIVVGRRATAVLARLRGREVPMRLSCPKRGCHVDCTLVLDEATGRYAGVSACSAAGEPPRCDHDCVKLLNLGLPLGPLPRDSGLTAPALEPEQE
jgi:hypothetical protein